jgi:hypothetical protein
LQAVAEVIPEADGLLGAGFHEAQERVTAIAPQVAAGSGGDFAPRYLAADIVFRAVGVQWDLRPLQHREQVFFLGMQPRQQPVERGKVRRSGKDAVEAVSQLAGAACAWRLAVGLEILVEPPDSTADKLLGLDVRLAERIELVDETFRMHPAQCVVCNLELAGAIGDDHRAVQEALLRNRAPGCAFGCDLNWIGMNLEAGKADGRDIGRGLGSSAVWFLAWLRSDSCSICRAKLGLGILLRLDQALGTQAEPLSPLQPETVYGAHRSFAEPISSLDSPSFM